MSVNLDTGSLDLMIDRALGPVASPDGVGLLPFLDLWQFVKSYGIAPIAALEQLQQRLVERGFLRG